MSTNQNDSHPERRLEGKEGAGAHQEGRDCVDAGQTQRREQSEPQKDQRSSVNDHQKTVSGKKQHGHDEKIGRDAGGNEGSKGQNVDARRSGGTGKQPSDIRARPKQNEAIELFLPRLAGFSGTRISQLTSSQSTWSTETQNGALQLLSP
jgi:hypothetical protein